MALVLYAGNRNKNAWTALIAAEYCGVKVELVKDLKKTTEFLKMNPMGKVPVLETPDGTVFGSNAIARYVTKLNPESSLFGSSPVDYGQVEQWIDFTALEIDANIASWLSPGYGFAVYLPLAEEAAIAALKRALGGLNTHLASTTYLVGYSVTLADIVLACNLATGFNEILTKSFTSEFPHVERYFWTMVNQPNFSKIMGKLEQAEAATINDLGMELIGEVLKRLPVKYILRCGSVKKSWSDFVRSSYFINLHLNHQLASPNDGLLFFKTIRRNSHNIRRDNVGCELYCTFHCSSPYPEDLHQESWCAHSNGLLCITHPSEWYASCKIHLCNPLTNKHKILPGPPIALQSPPRWHALAFGYMPALDDYFVVCIAKPPGKSNSLSISVYNLKSNSWRNFQQDHALSEIDSDYSFFVNNVAYWLGQESLDVQLVCFDTTNDTLRFVDLPEDLPDEGFSRVRLKGARGWKYPHVIHSSGQSVAYFYGSIHWETLYMFLLGEYDTWELKLKVDLGRTLVREKVLGIRKNGDLILGESDGLVTVDLENQVRTEFFDLRQLNRHPNAAASPRVINPFVESLLFFDEPKKEAAKPRVEEAPEEEAPKAKARKALDALPPSKMVLDEWKCLYSNTKTNFRELAVKGFWDMYDPEGYSLWFCKYKYNEENMVSCETLNKVGGFLQSMDLAREYAFGKMLVIGSQPPYKVWGLWLFRGKEIPQFVMDECRDVKLYEWTQVDINDEAQKERASQMIEDLESFEGEDLLEAKCFK